MMTVPPTIRFMLSLLFYRVSYIALIYATFFKVLEETQNFKTVERTKGCFFSENAICFSDLQISKKCIPKNYSELEF